MFQALDEQYLLRNLAQNQVILFLGAGFSRDAKNTLRSPMPTSVALSVALWKWLSYPGEHDGTTLQEMYQAALGSGRKKAELQGFLHAQLLCGEIPSAYDAITKAFWHRIYTTNVDDLVEQVYRRSARVDLEVLAYPGDETKDRDQLIERIQLIHLNGRLPCDPEDLTFSVRQYARRAGSHDPLYHQFAREYPYLPTIFIGTELNELLLWQYIELRASRARAQSEYRAKSFLIAPHISPPRRAQLKEFNVIPVEGYAADFLGWLNAHANELPDRETILRQSAPTYLEIMRVVGADRRSERDLRDFAVCFHQVPLSPAPHPGRSQYLLGTSPRWEDILQNLDAPREITGKIYEEISGTLDARPNLRLVAILGSAGCGKSTILRRLGLMLAQAGRSVYLTNSEEIPRAEAIARALHALNVRATLLFDNAESAIGLLPSLAVALAKLEKPPVMVVASRTNEFDRRIGRFAEVAEITEHSVPHLTDGETQGVIGTLDRNNLLGRLKGLSAEQRLREFKIRAHRQILVAMREATSGRGFDEILNDEFERLEPREAKILYLCTALATDAGYRLQKQEFMGCSQVEPAETLHLLERTLLDIVLRTGPSEDLLLLRHRQIAEYMVERAAPRPILREAYIRLLTVLAEEVTGKDTRSRTFRLYRDLINHHTIFTRFTRDVEEARSIYDSIPVAFDTDAQFWLQYGSLELEAGSLDLAESYLRSADSLHPGNRYIRNAIGNLLLKKAIVAPAKQDALQYREEGSRLLLGAPEELNQRDFYTYLIYMTQRLNWLRTWAETYEERKLDLEHLRGIAAQGCKTYPRSRDLSQLKDEVEREYFSLAVK